MGHRSNCVLFPTAPYPQTSPCMPHPCVCTQADLKSLKLSVDTFGTKFDVILVDPPWEEYVRRAPGAMRDPESWSWQVGAAAGGGARGSGV